MTFVRETSDYLVCGFGGFAPTLYFSADSAGIDAEGLIDQTAVYRFPRLGRSVELADASISFPLGSRLLPNIF
jgi:hypothetical protein